MCVLFQMVSEIKLFHCTVPKLLITKIYYVLFLIPVFIVQVTKLVQFTWYNTFSKIPLSTSMHFGIGYTYTICLLRKTDTMTSQNIDLSGIPCTTVNEKLNQ
jgi:uncharacterized membrane protein